MKTPTHHSRPGFTLVELLVVIVIIVTLAALSMVGFHKIRASADRAATVAVLRQLQLANHSYAVDNNGKYLPISSMDENKNRINDWHQNSLFLSYLTGDPTALDNDQKVTTKVPESILDPIVVRSKQRLWERLFASYGYNREGMPWPRPNTDRCFRVNQVTNPSRTAAFITATDWIVSYNGRFLWEDNPVEGKSRDQKIAYRHDGKAIVVYYDGSSGFVSPEDIRSFDQKGGRNHPFWKANH